MQVITFEFGRFSIDASQVFWESLDAKPKNSVLFEIGEAEITPRRVQKFPPKSVVCAEIAPESLESIEATIGLPQSMDMDILDEARKQLEKADSFQGCQFLADLEYRSDSSEVLVYFREEAPKSTLVSFLNLQQRTGDWDDVLWIRESLDHQVILCPNISHENALPYGQDLANLARPYTCEESLDYMALFWDMNRSQSDIFRHVVIQKRSWLKDQTETLNLHSGHHSVRPVWEDLPYTLSMKQACENLSKQSHPTLEKDELIEGREALYQVLEI